MNEVNIFGARMLAFASDEYGPNQIAIAISVWHTPNSSQQQKKWLI